MITEHLPQCKVFCCAEHGLEYLPMETDETKEVLCHVCKYPMSFECVIP
jgi:hypothetical protein